MPDPTVRLVVPRATGTAGDDLIAWGLARVLSDAIGRDVLVYDEGTRLVVDTRLPADRLDERLAAPRSLAAARLHWLESASNTNKKAPTGLPAKDRDALRDADRAVREWRSAARTGQIAVGEPSQTLQEDAQSYPLYRVLTSPGKRWSGYNSFVTLTPFFSTTEGLRLIVRRFRERDAASDTDLEAALSAAGLARKECRRNPPDFLLFGMNKGPTRPLSVSRDIDIGTAGRVDSVMVDRGDLSILDLFLAYVGYFAVARVLDTASGRVVLVPVPYRVVVPRGLEIVRRVVLPYSALQDLVAAHAALGYAEAVVAYLAELRRDDPDEATRAGTVLYGVAVSQFWKPVGTVFSPIRVGLVPLPRWLPAVYANGWEEAGSAIDSHRRQLRGLRGRTRDERLSSAQRDTFATYRLSLDGDARDWLHAVAGWFAPIREATRGGGATPRPWTDTETRRIAVALEASLAERLDHPSFLAVAGAIRAATVYAHFARQRSGPRPAFDPEYDLIAVLAGAAERSPAEFIAELCRFVARYNAAAVRPSAQAREGRRRLVRDVELRDVVGWLEADRRGVIAAALLAFGTSLKAREDETTTTGIVDDDHLDQDGEAQP